MAANKRYEIFHEQHADEKLTVLLSIYKFHPTYSELLKKVRLQASILKPMLVELEKQNYIVLDSDERYICITPLPSSNDIKIYRYILRHNPEHSKMLRSINDIDARHINAVLSKLQKDGLIHKDIKTGKYSILIQDDNAIDFIMNHYDTEEEVAEFVMKFRENIQKHESSYWNKTDIIGLFMSTFFDFSLFSEKNVELVTWFVRNGYGSILDVYGNEDLYSKIVEYGRSRKCVFWQQIDKYLGILNGESYITSGHVINALADDIDAMDRNYILSVISQMPTFRNKDEFIKALEQRLFNNYSHMLTMGTSYIEKEEYYSRYSFKGKLLQYYTLAYPENSIMEVFSDALKEYNEFRKRQPDSDNIEHFETFCSEEVFNKMGMHGRMGGYDLDKLYELIQKNNRVYSGKVTKRMKECLIFMLKNNPEKDETKVLKLILPNV